VINSSPESQERFRGDSGENLAELPLIARTQDGKEIAFKIVLGHPFRREKFPEAFAVRIELDGLETAGTPIMGVDQFQAIILAIRFMLSRLTDIQKKRGLELFWGDDPEVKFDAYEHFNTIL